MNNNIKKILIAISSIALINPNHVLANWDAEVIPINFPIDSVSNSPLNATAKKFKELVTQRLGEYIVKVNLYQLEDKDPIIELETGRAQIIAPALPELKRYSKRMQVFELPFLFYSPKAAENFLDGVWGERLLSSLAIRGIVAHGYLHRGMKNFTSHDPITLPTDLTDKRLGVFNSNTAKEHYKTLNIKTVFLNNDQASIALKHNLVDALENNWGAIYNQKIHDQQKYILETGHAYTGNVLITTSKIWETIPEELQPVLKQIIHESIEFGNQKAQETNEQFREDIIAQSNNVVNTLSLEKRYQWIEASRKVWSTYEDEIGTQLINAAASHR